MYWAILEVLGNMVLVLVWRYWAILAGGEKAVPASKWNPGVSTEQDVTSGSLQYYPASKLASKCVMDSAE